MVQDESYSLNAEGLLKPYLQQILHFGSLKDYMLSKTYEIIGISKGVARHLMAIKDTLIHSKFVDILHTFLYIYPVEFPCTFPPLCGIEDEHRIELVSGTAFIFLEPRYYPLKSYKLIQEQVKMILNGSCIYPSKCFFSTLIFLVYKLDAFHWFFL